MKLIYNENNLLLEKKLETPTFTGFKLQGRTKFGGMDISIENKKGSYRYWTDLDGKEGKTKMHYPYGYIRRTVGNDGDHVDCYIGDDKDSEIVFVIHQNNPKNGKYDEDKVMFGFTNSDDAKKAYLKHYDNPKFFGSMTTMTLNDFKNKVIGKKVNKINESKNIFLNEVIKECVLSVLTKKILTEDVVKSKVKTEVTKTKKGEEIKFTFGKNGQGITDELIKIGEKINKLSDDNKIYIKDAFIDTADDIYEITILVLDKTN